MPHVEQELPTPQFLVGFICSIFSFLLNDLNIIVCPLAIVLSVLWFMASDYPAGIFKLDVAVHIPNIAIIKIFVILIFFDAKINLLYRNQTLVPSTFPPGQQYFTIQSIKFRRTNKNQEHIYIFFVFAKFYSNKNIIHKTKKKQSAVLKCSLVTDNLLNISTQFHYILWLYLTNNDWMYMYLKLIRM